MLPDVADSTADHAPMQEVDRWMAPDKLRHFAMSYGVVAFSYGAARLARVEPDRAFTASAIAGLAAGFGKEISDASRGLGFSVRDLLWDFAGVGLGLVTAHNTR
jgi:putative lipoprotein